mmetsp:Transcript_21523/g.83575  ORF Transcript_21523/g.83575 Transcript_21523/m.83575 type:complete len:211 (+) Transcript_21523:2761-3393(+)
MVIGPPGQGPRALQVRAFVPVEPHAARPRAGGSVQRLRLRRAAEGGLVEAQRLGAVQQGLQRGLVHLRRARQHPGVLPARRAHQHLAIVRVQGQHPVVAVERPEEAHAQLGIAAAVDDLGVARDVVDAPVGEPAAVDDLHAGAVQRVAGLGVGHALLLEAVGQQRDLVPGAGVAGQVHRGHGRQRRGVGHRQQRGHQQKEQQVSHRKGQP